MSTKLKLTAKEKRAREERIEAMSSDVPEKYRQAYKTMLRQGGWLKHYQIKAGCRDSNKAGLMVAGLCRLGFATESQLRIDLPDGETHVVRFWKTDKSVDA